MICWGDHYKKIKLGNIKNTAKKMNEWIESMYGNMDEDRKLGVYLDTETYELVPVLDDHAGDDDNILADGKVIQIVRWDWKDASVRTNYCYGTFEPVGYHDIKGFAVHAMRQYTLEAACISQKSLVGTDKYASYFRLFVNIENAYIDRTVDFGSALEAIKAGVELEDIFA